MPRRTRPRLRLRHNPQMPYALVAHAAIALQQDAEGEMWTAGAPSFRITDHLGLRKNGPFFERMQAKKRLMRVDFPVPFSPSKRVHVPHRGTDRRPEGRCVAHGGPPARALRAPCPCSGQPTRTQEAADPRSVKAEGIHERPWPPFRSRGRPSACSNRPSSSDGAWPWCCPSVTPSAREHPCPWASCSRSSLVPSCKRSSEPPTAWT